jgi:hypothetical protein
LDLERYAADQLQSPFSRSFPPGPAWF